MSNQQHLLEELFPWRSHHVAPELHWGYGKTCTDCGRTKKFAQWQVSTQVQEYTKGENMGNGCFVSVDDHIVKREKVKHYRCYPFCVGVPME